MNENYNILDNEIKMEKEPSFKEIVKEALPYILFTLTIFILLKFVLIHTQVPTGSMKSTIAIGDHLIGVRSNITNMNTEPKRGDIVVFKFPDDESQLFVKRVIGISGDIIQIKFNGIYINGEIINEPYLNETMNISQEQTFVVPDDSFFMMGDNRNDSLDSRYWDNPFVTKDKIVAKIWAKFSFRDFKIIW